MGQLFRNVILTASFLLLTSAGFASVSQDQAVDAALAFTSILDEESFTAAYWGGSELLRRANDEQEWVTQTERAHNLLGDVLQRELKKVRSIESFPGLPDDDYVIVFFEARTEHKEKAIELFLVHQSNGTLQVCSYSIR